MSEHAHHIHVGIRSGIYDYGLPPHRWEPNGCKRWTDTNIPSVCSYVEQPAQSPTFVFDECPKCRMTEAARLINHGDALLQVWNDTARRMGVESGQMVSRLQLLMHSAEHHDDVAVMRALKLYKERTHGP